VRSPYLFLTAVLVLTFAAAPASAAIRYTQPNGFTFGSCDVDAKCDFEYRFRVTVRDKAGNRSDPAVISFRVVRG